VEVSDSGTAAEGADARAETIDVVGVATSEIVVGMEVGMAGIVCRGF
jgi:hypothetical protein